MQDALQKSRRLRKNANGGREKNARMRISALQEGAEHSRSFSAEENMGKERKVELLVSKKTVKIRNTEIGVGIPKICIPLVAADRSELTAVLAGLDQNPWDLVEWRADFYKDTEKQEIQTEALQLIREKIGEKPLLYTFRTGEEGGNRRISREMYKTVIRSAVESGLADLVDVELNRGEKLAAELIAAAHSHQVAVLGSFHDFEKTPSSEIMTGILRRMQQLDMDITKLAVMPRDKWDVLKLLEASVRMEQEWADRPFVMMSMGALGSLSRIAGSFSGSAITFGMVGKASAPGQLPAPKLENVLRIMSECIG